MDASDPDIKYHLQKGRALSIQTNPQYDNTTLILQLYSPVIEERVLKNNEKQQIAYVKGVDSKYAEVVEIDTNVETGAWLDLNLQTQQS